MEYLQPLSNIFALFGLLAGGLWAIINFFNRLTRLETKVDAMWNFLWKRAISEAVTTGAASHNSPIEITQSAKKLLDPLLPELEEFSKLPPPKHSLSNQDLALEIEKKFGLRLLEEVCIPNGYHMGACLVVAVDIIRAMDGGSVQGGPTQ